MWISQVELDHIKSYGRETKIDLVQGVNAVCGQNGAGKSTILEAIGLALFGQSAYKNQDQLINLKAKKGKITITLIDSRDERLYQVVRPIKGGGTPYVFDPETQRQVASGVDDVQQWLCDCLGVEPTTDLKALFEHAIGVPQGMLTTAFLFTEANRRKVFDPLLGVEDYKKVWDSMLAVVNHVKDQKGDNAKAQERLAGKLEDLPRLKEEAQELEASIEKAEQELEQVAARLAELTEALRQFKEQKETLQDLESQNRSLAEQRKGLENQLNIAEADLKKARQAHNQVEKSKADYQAYEQARQEQSMLEEKRKTRDEARQQLTACERELAIIEQAIGSLEKQLTSVTEAEAKLVELEPLVQKQEALEEERKNLEKAVADLRMAEERVQEETKRLENLRAEIANVQSHLGQRQTLTGEIEERQQQRANKAGEIEALDKEIAGLDEQLEKVRHSLQEARARSKEYEQATDRVEEIGGELDEKEYSLTDTQAEVEKRGQLEQSLQALNVSRQERKDSLVALEEQIRDHEASQQKAQTELNDWLVKAQQLKNTEGNLKNAQKRLAETEAELTRLQEALERRKTLATSIAALEVEQEAAGAQRDKINGEISRCEARLKDISETRTGLEVEAETPCPVCQKPLSEHDISSLKEHYQDEEAATEAELNTAKTELKQVQKSLKQLKQRITQDRKELEQLPAESQRTKQQETVTVCQDEVTGLQQEAAGLAGAPFEVEQAQKRLDNIKAGLSSLKKQQAELRAEDEAEGRKESDISAKIVKLARQVEVDRLQQEIEELRDNLAHWQQTAGDLADAPQQVNELSDKEQALVEQRNDLQQQLNRISNERERLTQEISEHQTEISGLASPDRLPQLLADLERQTEVMTGWQEKVTELSAGPDQLQMVKNNLAVLGDPRRSYQNAQNEAVKRPGLESEQATKQNELEQKRREKAGIEAELQPFEGLDEAFEQVKTILAKTGEAHQTYLAQQGIAQTLPERQARAEAVRQEVAEATSKQEKTQASLDEAEAAYSPEQHKSTEQEADNCRTRQTELRTEQDGDRKQLGQRQKKITELEAVAADLEALQKEEEHLSEVQTVVEFIRRTIRDAGPEVTKRLVKAISLKADGIFADIMDDHQQELAWDETYAITVEREGYQRDFQQLSGGEAMAAALAVRLALLQSMSAVDVAFFDEPTANLDPERRANLAAQIARIRGFSQLVVISHDDTFEQDTAHVVHIARNEQGYSQVV